MSVRPRSWQPIDTIERADRVFVFWSGRTRTSREVTREWQTAVKQVGAAGEHNRFITPIMLGYDRPEDEHPLARFESIDLGALADALIVTAVKEEYEAVLGVDTGARTPDRRGPAGSSWVASASAARSGSAGSRPRWSGCPRSGQ